MVLIYPGDVVVMVSRHSVAWVNVVVRTDER